MGSQVVRYQLDDSSTVGFEIDPGANWNDAGAGDLAGRVRDAVKPAVEAAKVVLEKAKEAGPDSVEVKFGVKITGQASWIVAKAATEGSFEVTLTWGQGDSQAG